MARKEIGPSWDRNNRNAMNDNFQELYATPNTTIKRMILGSAQDLILKPPSNMPIVSYAAQVGDPYFVSLQAESSPANSISPEKKITLTTTGYFFYRLSAINDLTPGKPFTFFVRAINESATTKVEYRFTDAGLATIGSIKPFSYYGDGIYGAEGVIIPTGTSRIEIRLDNRGSSGSVIFENPFLIASEFLGAMDDRIENVATDIKTLDNRIVNLEAAKNADKPSIPVLTPADFGWQGHPLKGRIFTDGRGDFYTDFDVSELRMDFGKTYFVDGLSGLDTNPGTRELPFKNIRVALGKADVGTIMLKGGQVYNRTSINGTISKNINLIGYEGVPVIGWYDSLTFTLSSGQTKTYQANRSAVQRVIDLKFMDGEDELEYVKRTSVADVEANPGSWYTDGTVLYIHTKDGRTPDSNVLPFLSGGNIKLTDAVSYLYLENIALYGGDNPIQFVGTGAAKILQKNTQLKFAGVDNGLEAVGGALYISQNSVASKSPMDGFNYHANGTSVPNFIEIDCIGRDNGTNTGGNRSDNGSTAHDGIKGIRIRGKYYRNNGGNIADVNSGTDTWNLGSIAFESGQGFDFLATSGAKIRIDEGKGFGSRDSIYVDTSSTVYVRGGQYQSENIAGQKVLY